MSEDKRSLKKGTTVFSDDKSVTLPTKYGMVQYTLRPVRVVNGCVTTMKGE